MDPRQFFTSNTWWGKIAGAFFGYVMAGPAGAFLGVLIGNFFDRGIAEFFSNPHWHFHAEKRKNVQNMFFKATFSVMGFMAKADGRVSESEIAMARKLMREMHLSKTQESNARSYFTAGKQANFDIDNILLNLKVTLKDNPALLKLFIDIQYRAAQVDGLTEPKVKALNYVLKFLGFVPLQEQYRFYEDFVKQSTNNNNRKTYNSSSRNSYQSPSSLGHAFAILGIPANSSKAEVKKAYRRMISRNHPDKLIAEGLPEEMVRVAKEKTQNIIKAYDQICAAKGW